jgi:hypothetical protein
MDNNSDTSSWTSSETEGEVCENCRKMDFSLAFTASIPFIDKLLSRSRLPRSGFISTLKHFSASCELCKEFGLASSNTKGHSDTYHLRAFSFPTTLYQPDEVSTIVSPKRTVWLQPMPCNEASNGLSSLASIAELAQMSGWAACYVTTDGPGMFQPQPITKRFNAALVKKWLSACMEFHSRSCDASVSVPGLLLIDCETLQLCRDSYQPPYVALSYVWGKTVSNDVEMPTYPTIGEQQHLPPDNCLSQVVKDSISVTKQIGFRYLWIDKYCINQCDAATQKDQIENMDLIYMGAELTIIAAAGENERHGLPGVGVERLPPRSVEIGNFTITHVPTEPWVISSYSKWAKRAWTFQEELLSRRRLYFSNEQVFFICHGMLCCEAQGGAEYAKDAQSMKTYSTASLGTAKLDKLVFMARNMVLTNGASSSGAFLGSGKERLRGLWELITEYSARDLTYDFDALRAFAGIRRLFEGGECPIYDIQGLPVGLSVELGSGRSLINLVSALCWEHHEPEKSRRRTEFPSWTWVGWTRRIHFPSGLETTPIFEVDSQSILVEYEDGYTATMKELAEALAALYSKRRNERHAYRSLQSDHGMRSTDTATRDFTSPKTIQLHAPLITAELFSFTDPTNWETGSFAGMQLFTQRALLTKHDMPFTPLYLLNGLVAGTLGCVLLRVDNLSRGRPSNVKQAARAHLLLLQWHGVTEAHRVGKMMAREKKDDPFNPDKLIGKIKWRNLRLL